MSEFGQYVSQVAAAEFELLPPPVVWVATTSWRKPNTPTSSVANLAAYTNIEDAKARCEKHRDKIGMSEPLLWTKMVGKAGEVNNSQVIQHEETRYRYSVSRLEVDP